MTKATGLYGWTMMAAMVLLVALSLLVGQDAAAQIPQFKIENPQIGHATMYMGRSVDVDGDTMIAGAPWTTRRHCECRSSAGLRQRRARLTYSRAQMGLGPNSQS